MGLGWTIRMGPANGVLQKYDSYVDFDFYDFLYDFGAGAFLFTGLSGQPAPQKDWVIEATWDEGLSSEESHWFGVINEVSKRQEGNIYIVRAYTPDGVLNHRQTGEIRNYLAKTPHTIMQAAGTPNPLLVDNAGATAMVYGSSASVPNKVDGANPGIALTQFVADSGSLFRNMQRLCLQSRYNAVDYGLEWTTTLEGANGSDPRFYLVKRRERAAAYTPETFAIPTDFHRIKRGNPGATGVDRVILIGGGDGNSRISAIGTTGGPGSREQTINDKSVLNNTNAANMAIRLALIFDSRITHIMATTARHASPTRTGDLVTVTQSGFANENLRVMMRHYSLSTKMWTFMLGRPAPIGRDLLRGVLRSQVGALTSPQFTDLVVPRQFPSGLNLASVPFNSAGGTTVIGAGASAVGVSVAPPSGFDGDCEGYFVISNLTLDGASPRPGGTVEVFAQFEFASDLGNWHSFGFDNFGDPAAGSTNLNSHTYPFKLNQPLSGDTDINAIRLFVRNRGSAAITISNATTSVGLYRRPKHQHNEL